MKKIVSLLMLTILLSFGLCGCGDKTEITFDSSTLFEQSSETAEEDFDDISVENFESPINKDEITMASPYSEGLMFVKMATGDERIYCVDKKGVVAFELDGDKFGAFESKFAGNYAFVTVFENGGSVTALCDKKGNIVYPADVGASDFQKVDGSLEEGYIIATKVTADYSSTRKEMGVLNTKLEWIVPLSETLHNEFANWNILSVDNFVENDMFYSAELAKSLNLQTGEVKSANLKESTPSSKWGTPANLEAYYRIKNNVVHPEDGKYIDLWGKNVVYASKFANGKAGLLYHNEDAGKYYVAMIDESGTNMFEPCEVSYSPMGFRVVTDGKYLVAIERDTVVSRNERGEKIGEYKINDLRGTLKLTISNGVVTVSGKVNSQEKVICLDYNMEELFK